MQRKGEIARQQINSLLVFGEKRLVKPLLPVT